MSASETRTAPFSRWDYSWRRIRCAAVGTVDGALNWSAIIGAGLLGGFDHLAGHQVMFPDGNLGVLMSGIVYTLIAGAVIFLYRLLWAAPQEMAAEEAAEMFELSRASALRKRRVEIKQHLGAALQEGGRLMSECSSADNPDELESRMNDWLTRTHEIITSAVGQGEATLLLNGTGLTVYSRGGAKNSDLLVAMDPKMQRIADLIERIDNIALNDADQQL